MRIKSPRAFMCWERKLGIEKLGNEKIRIGSWGRINSSRLKIVLKYSGRTILDAGCATGEYVRYLLGQGYDPHGLDILRYKEWEGIGINRFKIGDLQNAPFGDGEFETVLAFEVLEHVEDVDKSFRELRRMSRKNIIVSVPDAETPPLFTEAGLAFHHWIDRTHCRLFDQDALIKKIEEHGFSVVHFEKINPVCPELIYFESLRLPKIFQKIGLRLSNALPWKKKYYMTLIAVAEKVET